MTKLTVVLSVYNEEKKIAQTLQSVQSADEIIVVDNQSTDKTADIAKQKGAIVYSQPNNLILNKNKNFGFTKASNEWILNLDGDESVSVELFDEIKAAITSQVYQGYQIPRKNIIFGKWIKSGIWWPDYQLRLFKKGSGKFSEKHVHEKIELKGQVGVLNNPIFHNNYESISQYIYKMNALYSSSEVENYNKQFNWLDAIALPLSEFCNIYFRLQSYKDGFHGFALALLQAFYQLVIVLKKWEEEKFPDIPLKPEEVITQLHQNKSTYMYWRNTYKVEQSKNFIQKIIYLIRRRLGK